MSSQAGPSSSSKPKSSSKIPKEAKPDSKSKVRAKSPTKPIVSARSKETIDTDSDDDDDDDDDAGGDSLSSSEADSEGDLEDIQPARKSGMGAANGNGNVRPTGGSWPKYTPPSGMTPLNVSTAYTNSPFEWDALASKPGVQLWAIRVPSDLKTKNLSSLQLSKPSSSSSTSTTEGRVGSLTTKHRSYNLVEAGHTSEITTAVTSEGRDPTSGPSAVDVMRMDVDKLDEEDLRREGGEEMQGLSLMVPRFSKKGKLFVAPKPITRHLILEPDTSSSAEQVDPSTLPSFLSTGNMPIQPPQTTDGKTKRVQPTHLFKFRNNTVGFHTPGPGKFDPSAATILSKNASTSTATAGVNGTSGDAVDSDTPVEKKKKRKSEKAEETPKKKKKTKA